MGTFAAEQDFTVTRRFGERDTVDFVDITLAIGQGPVADNRSEEEASVGTKAKYDVVQETCPACQLQNLPSNIGPRTLIFSAERPTESITSHRTPPRHNCV